MANILGRFMTAVRAGVRAFNGEELVSDPIKSDWDLWDVRVPRQCQLNEYHNNTIYANADAAMRRHMRGLYRNTRGIINPVKRGCDAFAANVYPGSIDMENFAKGAIPLANVDKRFKDGFRQLAIWSNLQVLKSRYVRDAAKFGDAVINIVDDRAKQKVYMELLDPRMLKDVQVDSRGNVKAAVIEYEKTEDSLYSPTNSSRKVEIYTYTLVITKDWFETYRNGESYAYYENQYGEKVARWPNEYPFIPIVLAKFQDIGNIFGAAAFYGTYSKIDELNDAVSNVLDQTRKTVQPIWYFAGVQQEDELDTSPDSENPQSRVLEGKDKLRAIYGPEGSQPYPMIASIDAKSAVDQYMGIFAEIQRDMPVLSLPDIRQQIQATAPGVEAAFQDGIGQIVEAQGSLDDPFRRGVQMAFTMAAIGRYKNFEGFTRDSYERGDLDFYIPERSVIKDKLTKESRVNFLVQTNAPQSAVWKELDYTDDTIRQWQREIETTQQAQELQVQRQIDAMALNADQPGNQQGQLPQPQRQAIPERVN